MKIAVLGTGNVGGTLGSRWACNGHEVIFGSRDPSGEKVTELLGRCGDNARAASANEAVAEAEVVVMAAPWTAAQALIESVDNWQGKVLIDCINPLNADFTGLDLGYTTSAAEQVSDWASGARVVKAFNTASTRTMADPVYDGQNATMFYCGDDAEAKATVSGLAEELGFQPVDAGPLSNARHIEPLAMLYIHLAVREGWGSNCALKIMKR